MRNTALVVSRSRTKNPLYCDLDLSGVSIRASPNLDILGVKCESRLTLEDHARGIVSAVSERIGILRFYAFVHQILEYCSRSPVCGSAAECHFQLLERQVYSVARLRPDQPFLSLCHRRNVAALCML